MIGRIVGRLVVIAVVASVLGLVGCGGSEESSTTTTTTTTAESETTDSTTTTEAAPEEPTEDLGDFYTRRIDYEFKGQFGRSWDELHPGQQALVPRTKYEECRDESSEQFAGAELKSLEVVETYEDPIEVIGVPERTSTAVTVRIAVTDGSESQTVTDTFHAIAVNGKWVWILPPADIRAFKAGNCPA